MPAPPNLAPRVNSRANSRDNTLGRGEAGAFGGYRRSIVCDDNSTSAYSSLPIHGPKLKRQYWLCRASEAVHSHPIRLSLYAVQYVLDPRLDIIATFLIKAPMLYLNRAARLVALPATHAGTRNMTAIGFPTRTAAIQLRVSVSGDNIEHFIDKSLPDLRISHGNLPPMALGEIIHGELMGSLAKYVTPCLRPTTV